MIKGSQSTLSYVDKNIPDINLASPYTTKSWLKADSRGGVSKSAHLTVLASVWLPGVR